MRKTIDEIKFELSTKPKKDAFRLISKEEQQYYWGTQRPIITFTTKELEPAPRSKTLRRKKKLSKLSPLLFPTSFPNN